MSKSFKIRNWRKFQMYKDRNPTWICVHVALLDDLDWEDIPDVEKWHIIAIWLLAADRDHPKDAGFEDGPSLRYDAEWIQRKCSLESKPNLDRLVSLGYITCNELVTDSLRTRYDTVPSETETEAQTETDSLSSKHDDAIKEIVGILNTTTGKTFKHTTAATRKVISGRLNDGYTVDDFVTVIKSKYSEWRDDKKYVKFLRPSTLFNPTNFENYIQAAKKPDKPREYKDNSSFDWSQMGIKPEDRV